MSDDLEICCGKYAQCFPEDDKGIPPGCGHHLCPLNHDNYYLNTNGYIKKLGNIGYEYFATHRKFFFGFASIVTVVAMVLTTYGCFALSIDRSIIQRTYWAAGTIQFTNTTTGLTNDHSLYIGLTALVYIDCPFEPGYDHYSSTCKRYLVEYWNQEECKKLSYSVDDACSTCANVAINLWICVFMSCLTLTLSLLGAQTRMRVAGDVPVQKLLGMGSETWNALSIGFALYNFHHQCYTGIVNQASQWPDSQTSFWSGPGYLCYVACVVSAVVRAFVHWVTPIPEYKPLGLCAASRMFSLEPLDKIKDMKSKTYPDVSSPSQELTSIPVATKSESPDANLLTNTESKSNVDMVRID